MSNTDAEILALNNSKMLFNTKSVKIGMFYIHRGRSGFGMQYAMPGKMRYHKVYTVLGVLKFFLHREHYYYGITLAEVLKHEKKL
jgi:hypothetical protein